MMSYLTSSKMPLTDKDKRLTKAFQKEKHDTASIERISEQKLESSLFKFLSEKLINSVQFGSGRRRT